VKRVLLDGQPLMINRIDKHFNRQADITVASKPEPGDHTVAVEFECAFVDKGRLMGVG
jgi:hypothetical protein